MKKTRGQKSCDTVPLSGIFLTFNLPLYEAWEVCACTTKVRFLNRKYRLPWRGSCKLSLAEAVVSVGKMETL
jgi:hypothetical protein